MALTKVKAKTAIEWNNSFDISQDNQVSFTGASSNSTWSRSANAWHNDDNTKVILGSADDLQIYHSGSHSFIKDSGTGNLQMWTNQLSLLNAAGSESMIQAIEDGAVELYHNNVKRLETKAGGVQVSGNLMLDTDDDKAIFGAGNDLQIFHNGSESIIDETNQHLIIKTSANNKNIFIQSEDTVHIGDVGANEFSAKFVNDGAVELYHNNIKKLNTHVDGVYVNGSNLRLVSGEGVSAKFYLQCDEGDDNDDYWRIVNNQDNNDLTFEHGEGTYADRLTMTKEGQFTQLADISNQGTWVYVMDKDGGSVDDSSAQDMLLFKVNGNARSGIESGSGGTDLAEFVQASDRRLKTNFRTYTGGWDKIKQIPVQMYDEVLNDNTKEVIGSTAKKDRLGWIADEFQKVFPEAVRGTKDGVDSNGKPIYQAIAPNRIFPDLVQALQTAITKIETLEAEVAALKAA